MPTKKKTLIEENIEQIEEVEEKLEETPKKPPAGVEPICLNCMYYSQGGFGPTCVNSESIFNGLRMREEDTCEAFTAKVKP